MEQAVTPTNVTPVRAHLLLPDKDGVPVRNSFEPWQSTLLSETLEPHLQRLLVERDYFIGQDNGIYWEKSDPPALGCKAPDWYLVTGVPHLLGGQLRRSYVLWEERVEPLVILEYASDGSAEEYDQTPGRGKFWVYERKIKPRYYGIIYTEEDRFEMHHRVSSRLRPMPANEHGRYAIEPLGVELGIWQGTFGGFDIPWLRWWDSKGNLLLTGEERAEVLAAKLRSLGVNSDDI